MFFVFIFLEKKVSMFFYVHILPFVFFFFWKVSTSFVCILMYFVFFSLDRLLYRLYYYIDFCLFFIKVISIRSFLHWLGAYSCFLFFLQEDFDSFRMLFFLRFLCFFYNKTEKKKNPEKKVFCLIMQNKFVV